MVKWTAIVPIKEPHARKTRLNALDPFARLALSEALFKHVMTTVNGHPAISVTFVLSALPHGEYNWLEDKQGGLNAELNAARRGRVAVLVVHADLPRITDEDISALLETAERHGGAFAPDRHGNGTNAVALLAECPFTFCFGAESRRLHEAQLSAGSVVVRPGLGLDIDTPDDLKWLQNSLALDLRTNGLRQGVRTARAGPTKPP